MPILGKVNATPYECRVENMEIGASGYIYITCLIVTRKFIYLDVMIEVSHEDEDDDDVADDSYWPRLPIKRIGPGLTEQDFELDFSKSDEFEINIYPQSLDLILKMQDEIYILFKNFEIGVNNPGGESEPKTELQKLESRLQDAIDENTSESYDRAAKIRGQIAKEKQKTENKDK